MNSSRVEVRPGLTRFIAVAATSTLLAGVAACGVTKDGQDGQGTDPTAGTSPAASAEPSDSAAGSVVAAEESGRFLLPGDWTVTPGDTSLILKPPKSSGGGVSPGSASFGSTSTLAYEDELDVAAKSTMGALKGHDKSKRLPNVKFGGVTFYHLQAEDSATWVDIFGAIHNGRDISIRWLFTHIIDRKQATALINQVMPTFKPTS